MRLKLLDTIFNLSLVLLLLCMCKNALSRNPYKTGEVRTDYPKGCAYLRCKRGDQCVNRKFWCRNPPCPNMLYCSKSRKESLTGPSSCEAVRCTKGFICLVRVRHCRWGESCEQRSARCVSERDYYEGPASCVDFKCPFGLRCILRESLCAKPPCKLVKSCANTKDVKLWYEGCKSLGCLSEQECFLRRPSRDCRVNPCKHTPDCSAKSEEELEANDQCRGWVCPKGEDCSAHTEGPCEHDSCRISRSCHGPLMLPLNVTPASKHSWRDDVKLSFYSKHDENLSTSGANGPAVDTSKNNQVPRVGTAGNEKISTNSAIGKFYENPIDNAPIYVPPNPRPTSSRPLSASPDIISGPVVQPTVTSLSTWLNHLKRKTGVEAIEAWIKKAERQENYGAFLEWLDSVKDMLGPAAYDLWIEEVRTMTVTSPAFQKWLPPIPTSSSSASPDFVEPPRNVDSANPQGLGISRGPQKSIDFRNNESGMNSGVDESGAIKINEFNEDSYIFPPKNDSTHIRTEITGENPVLIPSGIPTSPTPMRINEWQEFYKQDPRIAQQVYPFQPSIGNFVPWSNQAPMFQGFDVVDPTKHWYQQYQQSPGIDPRFSNPNTWQSQFSPLINPPRNQVSMDRRFLETAKDQDQQYRTNWSFQQPASPDLNFLQPNSWGDQFVPSPQRDQISVGRSFLEPGKGQQFQSDWSIQQPLDTNTQLPQRYYWPDQFGPSLNPQQQQQQGSIDQMSQDREKIPIQQFQTNWSFQQSLNNDPNFLRPVNWQDKSFSSQNPEWQQERDPRDEFNRRIQQSTKFSDGVLRQVNEEPFKVFSDNSTNEDTSWMKYYLDQTQQQYAPPEGIGTFPIAGENFGYESWPGSSYGGRSLADVPHRRTKHEDSTRETGPARHGDGDPGRLGETSRGLVQDPGLFPGFPWLMDQRLWDYYLRLRDQDSRNLYDNDNREGPPAFSGLSRTHRVDADARSPSPNPFFHDIHRDEQLLKYHWPNTYLHDRLYRIAGPWLPPSSITTQRPPTGIQIYDGPLDPFPKLNRAEVDGHRSLGLAFHDREFDAPGQPMGVPDLWNPKFRTSLSSVIREIDGERWGYRDLVGKERPISTTISPPVVPSSKDVAPQRVKPIASKDSDDVEDDDYQEGIKNFENYYDDDGIYPLLLSLQGYIETSKEEGLENSKNSSILPVYKVEDVADEEEEEYNDDYESLQDGIVSFESTSDDQAINLFKNVKYGGSPDFPNNLKSVFDVEAAMIMNNTTGESDVAIMDIKWEYEDDEEDRFVEDHSSFFVQSQDSLMSTHGLTSIEEARDWPESTSGSTIEGDTESDYYDKGVDYEDEAIPGAISNYNLEQLNSGDSLNREEVPEELTDSFYSDPDHKRFKKNRP